MTMTRAAFMALMEPKLSNIWFNAYPQRPIEWSTLLNTRTGNKATITDHKLTGIGALVLKGEGNQITYSTGIDGQDKTYTPVRFGGGYLMTQELIDHELYGQVEKFETDMMGAAIDGQETIAANIFNGAFGTTNSDGYSATGFDGLQLCTTAHTRLDGGANQANRPSTDVDLSLTAVQNAVIAFHGIKSDRGRTEVIRPVKLVISPDDMFVAEEIVGSEYKPGTANNEVNALRKEGLSYVLSHYKTDADSWFLLGDKHDLNFLWDVKPRQAMKEDFDAEVIRRKIVQGFCVGHGDWRGVYGSSGV